MLAEFESIRTVLGELKIKKKRVTIRPVKLVPMFDADFFVVLRLILNQN